MSSYLFPYTLPGVQFNYTRKYLWNTGVQQALSGKQSTIVYQQYPLVNFEYSFEFLLDSGAASVFTADSDITADTTVTADAGAAASADLSALVGLFNAVRGRADTFLHTDPDFNTITAAQAEQLGTFGTGDGTTVAFQLTATYQNPGGPGIAEIIQNLNGVPVLYSNGAVINPSGYSIGPTGIVTFTAAPADNAALTWAGSWYYRCRFDADDYDFKKKYLGVWMLDKINFTSVLL